MSPSATFKRAVSVSEHVFGTFGLYRYALAGMVMVSHVKKAEFSRAGLYAVFAFYILSGYVVTVILSNNYLSRPNGLRKYIVNRLLRIFPTYWIALIFSFLVLWLFPDKASELFPTYRMPTDTMAWVWNIITIGMTDPLTGIQSKTAILTPSWTLGIELMYWILIPQLIHDNKLRRRFFYFAIFYTIGSLSVGIYAHTFIQPLQYSNALAAALPFCTGMLLFMRKNHQRFIISHRIGILAIAAFIASMTEVHYFYHDPYSFGFGSSFIIHVILVAYLSQIELERLPQWFQNLDNFLGNLAYPIYLTHVPVIVILHLLFPALGYGSLAIAASLALSSLLAWILHRCIEIPVNHLRHPVKPIVSASDAMATGHDSHKH